MVQQAVILAAGRGSRLGEGLPKCLVRVGDRCLLRHQIDVLQSMGIHDICIVVGYEAERVMSFAGERFRYIRNPRYAQTNSLYSLWLARQWVTGPFLQINCDVLAHPQVYQRLLPVDGTALAYDSTGGKGQEEMKVAITDGLLTDISKQLYPDHSNGENLGLIKYDQHGAELLFEQADTMIRGGDEKAWAPAALARLAPRLPIRCIDVAGLPWAEIDFVEDILFAQHEIWPAIRAQQSRGLGRTLVQMGARALSSIGSLGGMLGELE